MAYMLLVFTMIPTQYERTQYRFSQSTKIILTPYRVMLRSWSFRSSFILSDQFLFIVAHCSKFREKSVFWLRRTWSLSCVINCIFNARGIANSPLRTWLGCVFLPNWPEAMHLVPTCGNKRNNIPPRALSLPPFLFWRSIPDASVAYAAIFFARCSLLARASECTATFEIIQRLYAPTISNTQIRSFYIFKLFNTIALI